MINLACWNVRGLNGNPKQLGVKSFIVSHKLCLVGLVETRVQASGCNSITRSVFGDWDCFHNYSSHHLGRIWVGWDPSIIKVSVIDEADQVVHCRVLILDSNEEFLVSFVYGANDDNDRTRLWNNLSSFSNSHGHVPWLVL